MDKSISLVCIVLCFALAAWTFVGPYQIAGSGDPASPATLQGAEERPASAPALRSQEQQAGPTEWRQITKRFGDPGQPGSFEIVFDNLGGTIESVRLMDIYNHPDLTPQQKKDPAYWYRIVTPMEPKEAAIYSYRLEDPKNRFSQLRIEQAFWKVEEQPDRVIFRLDAENGLSLEKEFRHTKGNQHLDLTIRLLRTSGAKVQDTDVFFRLLGPCALPNPLADQVFGNPSRVIGELRNQQADVSAARYEAPDTKGTQNPGDLPDVVVTSAPQFIRFVAAVNRFFAGVLSPVSGEDANKLARAELFKVPLAHTGPDGQPLLGPDGEKPYSTAVPVLSFYLPVPKEGNGAAVSSLALRAYLGPKDNRVFESRPEYVDYLAIRDIDLEPTCFCSIPGAKQLGKVLLWVMNIFYGLVHSWGLSIIMLTILVRGALVPLNFKQQKSLRAYQERMTRLKPRMDSIREKYKKNQQRMNQELIAFNKEHKLFPPLMGCLPMFVTLPVFIGLFTALRIAYELRHQGFLFFIKDLSEPDRLIPLPPFTLPLLGVVRGINLMPFVMVALWLFLQRGLPLATDPQQRQMQKMMKWMPILIGFTFYNYASALMVYMICSSLFGIVEQKITKARLGSLAPGAMPTM